MKFSVKLKLMLAFSILIFTPLTVLGGFSYKMCTDALQNSTQQQLKEDTANACEQINKTVSSVKNILQVTSLNDSLEKVAETPNDSVINSSFNFIQNVQKNNKDSIEEVIITDTSGKVIIDSDSKEPNLNIGDRDYFKKAISGSEAVSEVLVSRFTGNHAIFIAYPLKNGEKIVGTLVGSIKFDIISSEAKKIKVGNSGYAYMIDRNALIVYHPTSSKILKENISDTTSKELKAIVNEMKNGKTSEGFYNYEGAYKYVSFKPAGNWVVAVTDNYDDYMSAAIKIRNNTIYIVILFIFIAILSSYVFSTRAIVNPIKKIEQLMRLAGDGDLKVNINLRGNDEIKQLGDSFNSMISHQHEIVTTVLSASQQLNAASEEMAASSEEINAASEEINASINEVATAAEKQNDSIINASEVLVQLSSLVQMAQNRANATSSNADNTMTIAELGRVKVDETVKAIDIISKGTDETVLALDELNSLSVKVGGISNTINSISEQTNLLALNAAIEAARAGENGKGFSVVADEVRKLSEESNEKAKEISLLVTEIMKQTQNAVTSMRKAKKEVDNGVVIVSETDATFINIIEAVKYIVKNIEEILDITNDEVASSDQIVKLINEMATMTENTSAISENVSSATNDQVTSIETLTSTAEETSALSEELTKLVERFKL